MKTYRKPPLKYDKQVELLESRELIVPNRNRAIRHLSNISYYRLSAYMLPYKEQDEAGNTLDKFKKGTTWDDIYNLYVFDRKLRIFVFDAIERIEVAIRSQIIYQLSHKYGSHWQDNRDIFAVREKTLNNGDVLRIDVYEDMQKHIKEQLNNNKAEVFIQHYKNTYGSPINPPSWMSVEIMYFNHLSKICSGLKQRNDLSGIASYFDLPPEIFCSWIHTINYVRNLCAHHARLWNRELNIVPKRLGFSKNHIWISNPNTVQRSRMYYFLCMINYILQTANPTSSFTSRLKELLTEYKDSPIIENLGFARDWEKEDLWQERKKAK